MYDCQSTIIGPVDINPDSLDPLHLAQTADHILGSQYYE